MGLPCVCGWFCRQCSVRSYSMEKCLAPQTVNWDCRGEKHYMPQVARSPLGLKANSDSRGQESLNLSCLAQMWWGGLKTRSSHRTCSKPPEGLPFSFVGWGLNPPNSVDQQSCRQQNAAKSLHKKPASHVRYSKCSMLPKWCTIQYYTPRNMGTA